MDHSVYGWVVKDSEGVDASRVWGPACTGVGSHSCCPSA